jgi:hypothetical protein
MRSPNRRGIWTKRRDHAQAFAVFKQAFDAPNLAPCIMLPQDRQIRFDRTRESPPTHNIASPIRMIEDGRITGKSHIDFL